MMTIRQLNLYNLHWAREMMIPMSPRKSNTIVRPTNAFLIFHWVGIFWCDLTGKEPVDCLPVIFSGAGVDQLLGVPKLYYCPSCLFIYIAYLLEDWGFTFRLNPSVHCRKLPPMKELTTHRNEFKSMLWMNCETMMIEDCLKTHACIFSTSWHSQWINQIWSRNMGS